MLLLQAALVVVAVANFLIPPSSSSLACKEPLIKSPLLSSFVRNEGGRGEDFSKLLRENHSMLWRRLSERRGCYEKNLRERHLSHRHGFI